MEAVEGVRRAGLNGVVRGVAAELRPERKGVSMQKPGGYSLKDSLSHSVVLHGNRTSKGKGSSAKAPQLQTAGQAGSLPRPLFPSFSLSGSHKYAHSSLAKERINGLRAKPSLDDLSPAQSHQGLPLNAADTHGTARNVPQHSTTLLYLALRLISSP